MSGHNKWSKIKHKKEATDAKKSKVFSKLIKLIQTESKKASGDINSPGLKGALEKAKKENVPKENIERAVKKGASGESQNFESVLYEVYGPGGVALIIDVLTDNRNRTGAEIKHLLSKKGLGLSAPGSAVWAYEKKGGVWEPKTFVEISGEDMEKLQDLTEELQEHDDVQNISLNIKQNLTG